MKKRTNPFSDRAKSPRREEIQPPKPTSELSDAELGEALGQARRDLLDAQLAALREREKARVAPEDGGRTKPRNLNSIFKNSNRRRFS